LSTDSLDSGDAISLSVRLASALDLLPSAEISQSKCCTYKVSGKFVSRFSIPRESR